MDILNEAMDLVNKAITEAESKSRQPYPVVSLLIYWNRPEDEWMKEYSIKYRLRKDAMPKPSELSKTFHEDVTNGVRSLAYDALVADIEDEIGYFGEGSPGKWRISPIMTAEVAKPQLSIEYEDDEVVDMLGTFKAKVYGNIFTHKFRVLRERQQIKEEKR